MSEDTVVDFVEEKFKIKDGNARAFREFQKKHMQKIADSMALPPSMLVLDLSYIRRNLDEFEKRLL